MVFPDSGGQILYDGAPATPERVTIIQAIDDMDRRLGMPPHGNLVLAQGLGHLALPEPATGPAEASPSAGQNQNNQ